MVLVMYMLCNVIGYRAQPSLNMRRSYVHAFRFGDAQYRATSPMARKYFGWHYKMSVFLSELTLCRSIEHNQLFQTFRTPRPGNQPKSVLPGQPVTVYSGYQAAGPRLATMRPSQAMGIQVALRCVYLVFEASVRAKLPINRDRTSGIDTVKTVLC